MFKYVGAASRLSGSQNAAGSFSLNIGNTNPKDLVTDGSSLWVVNDSSADKVFKYTTAGTLLGSWTIDAANATPTGITIGPANASNVWIVDSGTDKVYQYDAAAPRASGGQSASTSFALAAGNTNPQGIADPPAPTTSPEPLLALVRGGDGIEALIGNNFAGSSLLQEFLNPTSRCDSQMTKPVVSGERRGVDLLGALMQDVGRVLDTDLHEDVLAETPAAGKCRSVGDVGDWWLVAAPVFTAARDRHGWWW